MTDTRTPGASGPHAADPRLHVVPGAIEPEPAAIETIDLSGGKPEPAVSVSSRRRAAPSGSRRSLLRRALVGADLIGLSAAFLASMLLDPPGGSSGGLDASRDLVLFLLTLPVWVVVMRIHGLYDRDDERADNSSVDELAGVFHVVTIGAWLLATAAILTGEAASELGRLVAFWALAIACVGVARAATRAGCRRSPRFMQNTVIVGAGNVGQLIARKMVKHPEYGIHVVGFVDSRPKPRRADLPEGLTILGRTDDLRAVVRRFDVERVIVAFSTDTAPEVLEFVRTLRDVDADVHVDVVPRLFELVGPRSVTHAVEGLALIGLPSTRPSQCARLLKRSVDIAGAAAALALAAPLFAYVAWRIRRDSPGPVLFRQTRLGYEAREFTALKFRTMRNGADHSIHREYIRRTMSSAAVVNENGIYKLDRADAVTPVGRWLRRTSLDELPQLLNVLRGDMSLVGPRPCIPYEIEHFQPHHFERFRVPQGMTGLWQVTARANATFGEALDMDVAYVRGWSLGLDLRLLLRTPIALMRQRSSTA